MKVLVCGLGAIGQRHVRMLRQVCGASVRIAAYRSRKLAIVISDKLEATEGVKPEGHYGIEVFDDFDVALADRPDAVFVTNPISMHVATALAAARVGAHLFLEKPVSSTMDGIAELMREVKERRLVTMVGFQLRYHPMLEAVRGWVEAGEIGNIISAELHFGEWLPGMHPYEDYRDSHAARADQGGGVINCLSHEIDLARWLVGPALTVAASGGHLSNLEMNGVEDVADLQLSCAVGNRRVPVHVHLDFLQRPMRRYGRIYGDIGTIEWDYPTSTARIVRPPPAEPEVRSWATFERNDMFVAEVRDFVQAVRNGSATRVPLLDGVETLKVCVAAHRAMARGTVEVIA